ALKALAMGVMMDVNVLLYGMLPFVLYLTLLPTKAHGTRRDRLTLDGAAFALFTFILLFTSVSEWLFWDEFASRFNFIAVDYLVYTHEVIGNIQESYPVNSILALIGVIAIGLGIAHYRTKPTTQKNPPPRLSRRVMEMGFLFLLTLSSFFIMRNAFADISENRYLNQIARNGFFELFSAYRHNELSYDQFYVTDNEQELADRLRRELGIASDHPQEGITRLITSTKPETPYNLVLITVESLSADYMKAFGNQEGLTPNLDRLAKESLFFTNLYATGTRTVYGLSALTLSIPPMPGNSIVRRPNNDGLFSLGSVLNRKGYVSTFLYGGYGYFDNMNTFFAANGYGIVDRSDLKPDEISFANVWGVCDEDLFRRVLKENDAAFAEKKPFFQMIMTTSNHRPYTYPDNKIDIPSKTGRTGGVKYTDYAIGAFIEEARQHPWFDNTLFVIVADHTAGSAGKRELNPTGYHIPMLIYAPKLITPQKVDTLSSQIDAAPTILALLNMSYDSRFYGKNMLREGDPERAFISNYQQLGYLTQDSLTILKPVKEQVFYRKEGDQFIPTNANPDLLKTTLSYYQNASDKWKTWNKDSPN
ncbi:MAG: LTA synthase family protein, partial [Alphaproteobacteria bacterium]|nr:LTA synthase family protein [Alphaproteobacteria bacterium]